jgi:hypothetical protein
MVKLLRFIMITLLAAFVFLFIAGMLGLPMLSQIERRWYSVLIWILASGIGIVDTWQVSRIKQESKGPACEKCGYLLLGLREQRCPECGIPFGGKRDYPGIDVARCLRRVEAALTTLVYALLLGLIAAVLLIVFFPFDHHLVVRGWTPRQANRINWGLIFSITLLIFAVDGALHKATYGMRSRCIQFSMEDGQAISRCRAFLRVIVGILLIPVMPISIFLAIRDKQHRTLADFICGTTVVLIVKEDKS